MSYKGKKKLKTVYDPDEGYDLYAESYDEDYDYLRGFEKDRLFSLIGDLKGKKVLDLGCGTGRIIGELKLFGAEVFAVDISAEMVKITQKKYPDIKVLKADACDLPFSDNELDYVIATFLIVHVKDLDRLFGEVYRVLKDGGIFVLTNINQRKAPKLKLKNRQEIIINSFYHRPADVIAALKNQFFKIEVEDFVEEKGTWINQIIKARKL